MIDSKTELNDEELENVEGGTIMDALNDYKEFVNLGLLSSDGGFATNKVITAFNQFGIRYVSKGGTIYANRYYQGEIEITRDQAFEIVRESLENK